MSAHRSADTRCEHCIYWDNETPSLATGARRPAGADVGRGTCRLTPPSLVYGGGMWSSMFPEVHSTQWCSAFEAPPEDDDGAREDLPETVVQLNEHRRAA